MVEIPYVQCPTVFSCFWLDVLSWLDWKPLLIGVLYWVGDFAYAKFRRSSIETKKKVNEAWRLLRTSIFVCAFIFLFTFFGYSPYTRYQKLSTYASNLNNELATIKTSMSESELKKQIKQQEGEINRLTAEITEQEQRYHYLVQKLPPPSIDQDRIGQLQDAIKSIDGPRRVVIRYLQITAGRPGFFAQQLSKVFESASWHVRVFNAKKGDVIDRGVAIRLEPGVPSVPAAVKALQTAFMHAGIQVGEVTRDSPPLLEKIEIEVGEM